MKPPKKLGFNKPASFVLTALKLRFQVAFIHFATNHPLLGHLPPTDKPVVFLYNPPLISSKSVNNSATELRFL